MESASLMKLSYLAKYVKTCEHHKNADFDIHKFLGIENSGSQYRVNG